MIFFQPATLPRSFTYFFLIGEKCLRRIRTSDQIICRAMLSWLGQQGILWGEGTNLKWFQSHLKRLGLTETNIIDYN